MIKSKDFVRVISGKDKNKEGIVLKVLKNKDKVIVEGVNIRTKHKKSNNEGSIEKIESPIHISNVQIICPETKKPTRIGHKIVEGKKVRISKKTGNIIK